MDLRKACKRSIVIVALVVNLAVHAQKLSPELNEVKNYQS